jgi:hypothetical protein
VDEKQRDSLQGHEPQYYLRRPITRSTRAVDNRPIHPSPPVKTELIEESNAPIHPSPPIKPEPVEESNEPIHPSPPVKSEPIDESNIPIHPSELTMPPLPRPEELKPQKPTHSHPQPSYTKITDLRPKHQPVNHAHAGPLFDPMVLRTPLKPLGNDYPSMQDRNELGDIANRIDSRPKTAKPTKHRKKINLKLVLVPLLITVLVAAAVFFVVNKASSPKYSVQQIRQAKVVESLEQTPEYRDATIIGAGLGIYEADNGGSMPESLTADGSTKVLLCGQSCQGATATVTVGPLKYYTAEQVSFNVYTKSLSVTNTRTLYIVPNASCNNTKTNLVSGQSSGSSAILYAISGSGGANEQCLEV